MNSIDFGHIGTAATDVTAGVDFQLVPNLILTTHDFAPVSSTGPRRRDELPRSSYDPGGSC